MRVIQRNFDVIEKRGLRVALIINASIAFAGYVDSKPMPQPCPVRATCNRYCPYGRAKDNNDCISCKCSK